MAGQGGPHRGCIPWSTVLGVVLLAYSRFDIGKDPVEERRGLGFSGIRHRGYSNLPRRCKSRNPSNFFYRRGNFYGISAVLGIQKHRGRARIALNSRSRETQRLRVGAVEGDDANVDLGNRYTGSFEDAQGGLAKLLHQSNICPPGMKPAKTMKMSQGFCNYVWLVIPQCINASSSISSSSSSSSINGGHSGSSSEEGESLLQKSSVVTKVYSPLHAMRTNVSTWGIVDRLASAKGLGPKVVFESEIGIIHEFIPGRTAEDADLYISSNRSLSEVAKKISRLHSSDIPAVFHHPEEALIWSFLDSMLREIRTLETAEKDTEKNGESSNFPHFMEYARLEEEIGFCKKVLTKHQLPVVLAHGDLKPANVMIYEGGGGSAAEDNATAAMISLIDFELSGPNYRGYDIMKLFRKQPEKDRQENMRRFLHFYAREEGVSDDTISYFIKQAEIEAEMIEPLTWIEAVTFFALILRVKPDRRKEWISLAESRWKEYIRSKSQMLRVSDNALKAV